MQIAHLTSELSIARGQIDALTASVAERDASLQRCVAGEEAGQLCLVVCEACSAMDCDAAGTHSQLPHTRYARVYPILSRDDDRSSSEDVEAAREAVHEKDDEVTGVQRALAAAQAATAAREAEIAALKVRHGRVLVGTRTHPGLQHCAPVTLYLHCTCLLPV
jgi:hypothetical protein